METRLATPVACIARRHRELTQVFDLRRKL